MFFVKLLTIVAVIASVAWFCVAPGYEPSIAAITSLATLIGLWLGERQSRNKASQSQNVSDGGVAVQVGGDANLGNIQAGGKNNAQ